MIFSDLQTAVVARLLWDAYFTETGKEVAVLPENALDLLSEYEKAIAKTGGIVVIIGTPVITETEGIDRVQVAISVHVAENVALNRGKKGTQKVAADVGAKAMALLRNWTPNEDLWARIYFRSFQRIGEDEQGCDHWQLDLYTYTQLDLLVTALGTERGAALPPGFPGNKTEP